MPEVTLIPLTNQGSALLDQLQGEGGRLYIRERANGERSYAADPDRLAAILDRLRPDWAEHVAWTS